MSKILSIALNPAIDISSDADAVRHTHKTRTHNQRQHAGGGGINVARVIVELGGQCELLYLSGGATGTLLEAMLEPLGVKQHRFRIHDPVRVAFNVRELSTNLEYRFVPEGPEVTEEELAPVFDLLEASDADYIVASGSLPRGVAGDTYARMADIATRKKARFILDTSGEALHETLAKAKVFLVKPSLGELASFAGQKIDHENAGAAAQAIVRSGAAEYIAVTLGADGAILVGADSIHRVPAIEVPVKSAVGAGDSFVAAMTWSLAEGHEIGEAFRFGLAAGAAAVMTSGTELCRRADVLALYEANKG
ncbi:MAG: 1-phosphofructokinase family hexose kinase [Alphaproteobacteria bacterium]|nr:1-phosphofructokinase family hexose kinase [Rhizobiaceae bacterium]MBU3960236.1 1-phosphofructokinase family hexose kinase [Alphaproteobacteria bacterium]MBU4048565.1 1-phosphofructokinase family hexose kinase [Alphaproteobacteria bacterium]MBU4088894.1 1-phosphofructokinase family hexose kinase [Alphaproteobacteria bacterium]MBU4157854.1 1-phosphofructokinase family hexose kinase [Alphaproteobacteria bacterium]